MFKYTDDEERHSSYGNLSGFITTSFVYYETFHIEVKMRIINATIDI